MKRLTCTIVVAVAAGVGVLQGGTDAVAATPAATPEPAEPVLPEGLAWAGAGLLALWVMRRRSTR